MPLPEETPHASTGYAQSICEAARNQNLLNGGMSFLVSIEFHITPRASQQICTKLLRAWPNAAEYLTRPDEAVHIADCLNFLFANLLNSKHHGHCIIALIAHQAVTFQI
eukprot:12431433-Karenia_brevis.AAC.3